jgi:hypothetical protein
MTHTPKGVRDEVRERSQRRCEYCHLPERGSYFRFHVEHIVAVQHEGKTELDNLAWSCIHCNSVKGPNIASFDPETGELTALFHPRLQVWDDHFEIVDGLIFGKTAGGRTTAKLL